MASAGTSASKRQERFHGAFTGGFSAGFYNSVGSAEGWTPSTFTSSRDKRAAPREQRPEDFMDDEDGLLTEQLQARPEFDTLGSTAGDAARKHADREAAGGAIPGPAPSELIIPVGEPMGKKLLKTMGWREGQGVGSRVRRKRRRPVLAGGDESEEDLPQQARAGLGRKARELLKMGGLTFAPKNTDLKAQMVVAKTNLHGIGHDPFKDAPEFGVSRGLRDEKAVTRGVYSTGDLVVQARDADPASLTKVGLLREPPPASALDRGSRGSHGFVLDDAEDDVYEEGFGKEAYDEALEADGGNTAAEGSLVKTAKAWASGEADGDGETALASRRYARCPSDGRLPPVGFIVARQPDGMQKHWPPPVPPADFQPVCSFDNNVVDPLRVPASGVGAGLDAARRAQLLGEVRPLSSGDAASVPLVLPHEDSAGLPQGSSALSFLSPSARKKLLDAARGAGAPSGGSSSSTAAPTTVAKAGGAAAAASFDRRTGSGLQENASKSKEDVQFSLASKFTSEKPQGGQAEDDRAAPVGGVDPGSRPAGLTLRTPAALGVSSRLSPKASEHESRGTEKVRDPERSTLAWTPAPLLCRRLNVPVPKVSSLIDWAAKSGTHAGRGAATATAPQQDILGSLGKFVPERSAPRQPKASQVPLLKGMEQRHPPSIASAPRPPGLATAVQDNPPSERPPIDLFKSVFESESESDSEPEEDGESNGGAYAAVAGETGDTPTAFPTGLPGVAQQNLPNKASLRRGYGSESSDDETESVGRPGGEQKSISNRRADKQDENGREKGKARGVKRNRREGASSSRDASSGGEESDRSTRQRKSASRKRSSSKSRHKHKHKHNKQKSEKKHRKHEHKRKKSSSKR